MVLKSIFWFLNAVMAGILTGIGLFYAGSSINKQMGCLLLLLGIAHSMLSIWGHQKFVGRGLFLGK